MKLYLQNYYNYFYYNWLLFGLLFHSSCSYYENNIHLCGNIAMINSIFISNKQVEMCNSEA